MPQKSPLSLVNETFGAKDKLVAQAASLLGHSKDKAFLARLDNLSDARLLDQVIAAERKAKKAAAKPKTKPAA